MSEASIRVERTDDGSSTLFSERFGASYHSTHGALQESMHVFVRAGLEALPQTRTPIRILEIGFGSGLNAWLALDFAKKWEGKCIIPVLKPTRWTRRFGSALKLGRMLKIGTGFTKRRGT